MKQANLAAFDNSWYKPGPLWKRTLWHILNETLLNSFLPGNFWRVALLRAFGAKLGKGLVIKPFVKVKYPWKLEVGNHVWIGEGVWIDNLGKVSIGNNVCVSQGAYLLCGNHDYKIPAFDLIVGDITLEDGSWVGAKSVVCPGIRLASHSILTVGSILTRNTEPYGIYQGNPAQKVKMRSIE